MKNKILVGVGISVCVMAWAKKDPVVMTVNGEDVPKSEFEYLYHKNSQQQLSPQPLDEYAEMFKLYKLKVADALDAGIDTTAAFRKEMTQYRKELAAPYLIDSLFVDSLVEEAKERGKYDVETSHIMLLKSRSARENKAKRQLADSLRLALLGGADFEDLALRYSQDPSVKANKGNLGFIPSGHYPYNFEVAAYAVGEGGISEVVESPVGYHIIKGGSRRPAKGRIRASHIMKLVPSDAPEEQSARAKEQIDSLYALVVASPDKFAEIAVKNSDDRGSASKGGDLSWFGAGDMVPEFENAAYALADGEISKPVKSAFGWHIIKKTGTKAMPDVEEVRADVMKGISNPQDDRYRIMRKHNTERLASKHNASIAAHGSECIKKTAMKQGLDSAFFAKYTGPGCGEETIVEIDGAKLPVADYIATIRHLNIPDPDAAVAAVDATLDSFFLSRLEDAEENWLYENEPAYRNLLKEYHDGSLLYEISLRKVWDRAAKDKEGLQRYFEANKKNYTWTKPRVKGILVQAANDSVARMVKARMNELPSDSILPKIRKEFKGSAQFDRILVEEGANAMVDNIMFGAPEVKPSAANYTVYFLYDQRLLNAPEEVGDVRGQVTSDYQDELETAWIKELKKKYPVKENKKELKKVR